MHPDSTPPDSDALGRTTHTPPVDINAALNAEIERALGGMNAQEILDATNTPRPAARTSGTNPIRRTSGGRQLRTGQVMDVRGKDVFVEFGPKSHGICPITHFETPPTAGEKLEFVVERLDPFEGVLILAREGMIRVTLGAFVQAHAEQIATEPIIMSLPGNVGFARFATIPAVDAKTLRSMIEYEAKQQIPFPIEEVEWDSHVLPADDSGQLAIGIFAVTKERLHELLKLSAECGIEPDVLTLSSVAVYNALHFDLELEKQVHHLPLR